MMRKTGTIQSGYSPTWSDVRRLQSYLRRLQRDHPIRLLCESWNAGIPPSATDFETCLAVLRNPRAIRSVDASAAAWVLTFANPPTEVKTHASTVAWELLRKADADHDRSRKLRLAAVLVAFFTLHWLALLFRSQVAGLVSGSSVPRELQSDLLTLLSAHAPPDEFGYILRLSVKLLKPLSGADFARARNVLWTVVERTYEEGYPDSLDQDSEVYILKHCSKPETRLRASLRLLGAAGTLRSRIFLLNIASAYPDPVQKIATAALAQLTARLQTMQATSRLLRPAEAPDSATNLLLRMPSAPGHDHLLVLPAVEPQKQLLETNSYAEAQSSYSSETAGGDCVTLVQPGDVPNGP